MDVPELLRIAEVRAVSLCVCVCVCVCVLCCVVPSGCVLRCGAASMSATSQRYSMPFILSFQCSHRKATKGEP